MPRLSIPLAVASSPPCSLTVQAMSPKQPDSSHLLRAIDRLTSNARVLTSRPIPTTRTPPAVVAGRSRHVRARTCRSRAAKEAKNLLGSEQSPLLGHSQQELLAARGIDGAEQFFAAKRDLLLEDLRDAII